MLFMQLISVEGVFSNMASINKDEWDHDLRPQLKRNTQRHYCNIITGLLCINCKKYQLASCEVCHCVVQVLQESLSIPGTDIYLVYRSSQTSGYMSTILIQLTPDQLPQDLLIVHLRIIVEGLVFERVFEADPNLRYRFTWDRRNAYNQKVYGIVTANG